MYSNSMVSVIRVLARAPVLRLARSMSGNSDAETVAFNLCDILKSVEATRNDLQVRNRCQLVAVSKTKPLELIKACYNVGQRHFGENYVQELEEKSDALAEDCPEIQWHYIGQIQSNKIGKIAKAKSLFCVETLGCEKHCELFDKEMKKIGKVLNVLVQVNTSSEDQKGGVSPDDALALADFITNSCENLHFSGFMTIGSFDNSHMVPNPDFDVLFRVRENYAKKTGSNPHDYELSMGMSDDFVTAIAQGSTSVRVQMPFEKSDFAIPLDDLLSSTKPTSNLLGAECRPICVKVDVFPGQYGSSYLELGNTRILAKILGPKQDMDGGFHTGRLSVLLKGYESDFIVSQATSALSAMVRLFKYAKCLIEVELTVISADCGVLQAAILAGSLALASTSIESIDIVVARHIVVTNSGELIVDPPEMLPEYNCSVTVALLPSINQIVCCDLRGALPKRKVDEAISFGTEKALELYPLLRKAIVASLEAKS